MTKKAKRWNVQRIDHSLAGSCGDEEQNALCLDSSGHDQVLQQDGPGDCVKARKGRLCPPGTEQGPRN